MLTEKLEVNLTPWQATKIKERQQILAEAQHLYKEVLGLVISGVVDPTTIAGCDLKVQEDKIIITPPIKPSIVKDNANESDTK